MAAVSKSRRTKVIAAVVLIAALLVASLVARAVADSMRPDPLIGTWGYSTMGVVDTDSARLSETQLAKFTEAKSFAALVMQGFYITISEDGNATVEAFGRKIGATWEKKSDAEYVIDLVSASQDSDQRVALSSIDVNSERMNVKIRDDGKLEIENDAPTTPTGYRTYTVFEKVDPAEKVENALFNSADELRESVLAQTMGASDGAEASEAQDGAGASSEASSGQATDAQSESAEEPSKSAASKKSADAESSDSAQSSASESDASVAEDGEAGDAEQADEGYNDEDAPVEEE